MPPSPPHRSPVVLQPPDVGHGVVQHPVLVTPAPGPAVGRLDHQEHDVRLRRPRPMVRPDRLSETDSTHHLYTQSLHAQLSSPEESYAALLRPLGPKRLQTLIKSLMIPIHNFPIYLHPPTLRTEAKQCYRRNTMQQINSRIIPSPHPSLILAHPTDHPSSSLHTPNGTLSIRSCSY